VEEGKRKKNNKQVHLLITERKGERGEKGERESYLLCFQMQFQKATCHYTSITKRKEKKRLISLLTKKKRGSFLIRVYFGFVIESVCMLQFGGMKLESIGFCFRNIHKAGEKGKGRGL